MTMFVVSLSLIHICTMYVCFIMLPVQSGAGMVGNSTRGSFVKCAKERKKITDTKRVVRT